VTDPVLTSSWCTNWGAYNTPRLWSMVMNEDEGPGRAAVSAWRTLSGSVQSQREALLAAKADLIASWPPDQNASSAAFVRELDTLILRLDGASADAEATALGLNNIVNALQTAKTKIQPLWEQYKDKSSDLVPNWWDGAEDEIDEQARQHMITAEREVADSVALIKVPDPYEFEIPGPVDDPDKKKNPNQTKLHSGPGGGGGISATVPHDPVPPLPDQDPVLPDGPGDGGGGGGPTDGGPSSGGPGGGSGGGVVGGGGPDLAGVITPGQPPILPPGDSIGLPGGPGGTPPIGGGGGGVPGLLPGGGGVLNPSGGRGSVRPAGRVGGVIGEPSTGRGGGGRVGGSGTIRPGIGEVGAAGGRGGAARGRTGRVGGAGGVLGAEEFEGRGRTGRVGGVGEGLGGVGAGGRGGIGGPGAGGRGGIGGPGAGGRGGRAGRPPRPSWLPDEPVGPHRNAAGATGLGGMPGRGSRRSSGEDEDYDFDPDNPWAVAEGVDPVITPAPDVSRNDPGPNVIGWRG